MKHGKGGQSAEEQYDGLVDEAYDALDHEDYERAVELARTAIELLPAAADAHFVCGLAFFDLGEFASALEHLSEASARQRDDPVIRTYEAAARFALGEDDIAEKLLRSAIHDDPQSTDARYWLSMVVERHGRYGEADALLAECARLDPEQHHLPYRMRREDLERDLEVVLRDLPPEIAAVLRDVPIMIEDLPSKEMLAGPEPLAPDILGLFAGAARPETSVFDPTTGPTAVYLFQRNLERIAASREELLEEARITLVHEIGHYLGLDEDDLAERGLE
jgi:predicted Zn-dependent protease with MMP-like domain